MSFDQWKSKLKEAAQKAAEHMNFDEMARNDEYMHQEGLNVVRKGEKKSLATIPTRTEHTSALSSIELRNNEILLTPTKTIPSSSTSMASSTRSVASMRQHSSLGSMHSDLEQQPDNHAQNNDKNTNNEEEEEEEESENAFRKNKLRFLQDLDHRLSKPNQELELLPQYTQTNPHTSSSSESISARPAWSSPNRNNKKQPLWAKSTRSQSQIINTSTEDEAPLIVTTTTSSAVLDDTELQALAALQQQSSASASSSSFFFFFMPSFVLSWCSASVPSLRQYPKVTGLVLLLVLLYLLRVYSHLVVPVEGEVSTAPSP